MTKIPYGITAEMFDAANLRTPLDVTCWVRAGRSDDASFRAYFRQAVIVNAGTMVPAGTHRLEN